MDFCARHKDVKERFQRLEQELSSPEVLGNPQKLMELSKEHAALNRELTCLTELNALVHSIKENQDLLAEGVDDEEFKELIEQELEEADTKRQQLENDIKLMLLPKSKDDERNIIMEIRAGTGGDEAALFASDLFRMYSRFAETKNWKVEQLEASAGSAGGLKEVVCSISGKDVYRHLQYESGIHRVQRVPATESSGRIHTSAVSVAVLPEPEDVEVHIEQKDLRIDVYRSSGPGGQSVNTMDSAVRITHIPTGIVVQCQDEKSQGRNKEKAMRHLRAKMHEVEQERIAAERSADRKTQIGSGDRSEKIRTYNYPQNRVTDHRIGFTSRNLDIIMDGSLEELISQLLAEDYQKQLAEKLKEQ